MIDLIACTIVKALGWLLCRLPSGLVVWIGSCVGRLAYCLQTGRRQVGEANVRAAFEDQLSPKQIRRIVRDSFIQLTAGVLELLRLPVVDRAYVERHITFEGFEHFEAAVASEKPIILLTGHFGNWELSSIVAALLGHPIVALARAQNKFPKLYALLVSYRESKGCRIIHKGGAIKKMLTALDSGRIVGIVGDQASRQGMFVDFFGRPAQFAKGPFEIAFSKKAVLLPVFIRRVQGPDHRIVIEPPIDLSGENREGAVRKGIEQFAAILGRHIRAYPGQWLWMHKRWKHTPVRRILVLNDGKLGHLKQSQSIAASLTQEHPERQWKVVDIRYRSRMHRALCIGWILLTRGRVAASRILEFALHPQSAKDLLCTYADMVISCGAAMVPTNVLWTRANRAKSVVLMNPFPLPLRLFDLVIAPRHDRLPKRDNVLETLGAISYFDMKNQEQAKIRLSGHASYRDHSKAGKASVRAPVFAVFIGGDTQHYEVAGGFVDALIAQITAACESLDGWCLVTSSRRSSVEVERILTERLGRHPRCRFLLIASRDSIDGTMEGMLASADISVVTGESISMVSESCASGRTVLVAEPPLRKASHSGLTRHQRFLRELSSEGYIKLVSVPEIMHTLARVIKDRPKLKRLDELDQAVSAAEKLL